MKKISSVFVFIFVFSSLVLCQISSPSIISTSGNSTTNVNITLDWTIGEPVITTHQTAINLLSQGFHQPNYQIVSIREPENNFSVRLYPNPSTDVVFIESNGKINWILFDVFGRILEKNTSQLVCISSYSSGMYVLKIQQAQKEAIFQIIKP